jgi:hypothetical protein
MVGGVWVPGGGGGGAGLGEGKDVVVEWQRQKLLLIGNVKEGGGHLATSKKEVDTWHVCAKLEREGRGMEQDLEEDCSKQTASKRWTLELDCASVASGLGAMEIGHPWMYQYKSVQYPPPAPLPLLLHIL